MWQTDWKGKQRVIAMVADRTGDSEQEVRAGLLRCWESKSGVSDPLEHEFWNLIQREGQPAAAEELVSLAELHFRTFEGVY